MSENAISAQGTLIAVQELGVGEFFTLGELRDFTPPPLMRNPIETTAHNDIEEHFIVGIRRKGELQGQIGYRPSLESHARLVEAWRTGSRDIYRITYPDGPPGPDGARAYDDDGEPIGTQWLFSGFVTNVGPSAPVDDGLVADFTVRPTNTMTFIDAVEA